MTTVKEDIQLFFKELKLNKSDLWAIIVLILIFLFFLAISWLKWGNPIIDCGREPFIAQQLLTGHKLYTDIYYEYGPFTPYFLSIIFYFFGVNLINLFYLGIILSILSLTCIYIVSRTFLSTALTLYSLILITILFCFNPTLFNFIFPYTYSALIGMTLSIFFVLIIILQIKTSNNTFLYTSSIIVSLSIINKLEFGFALSIVWIIYLFSKGFNSHNISIKLILKNILIVVIIPILTIITLLYYCGYQNLLDTYNYMTIRFSCDASKEFIKFFSWQNFILSKDNLFQSGLVAILIFFLIYTFLLLFKKFKPEWLKYEVIACISTTLLFFCLLQFELSSKTIHNLISMIIEFSTFIPFLAIFIIIYYLYKHLKKNELSYTDKLLLLISLLTFLLDLRFSFKFNILGYGIYYSPLIVVLIMFLINQLSIIPSKIDKMFYYLKYYILTIVFLGLLFLSIDTYNSYTDKSISLKSNKGELIANNIIGVPLYNLIEVINKTTKTGDNILLFPEETLIYFLTDRKPVSKYHDFLPFRFPTKELELQFIQTLKNSNVKLIAISNRSSPDYKYKYWGIDYSKTIYEWINTNYELCGTLGNYQTTMPYIKAYGIKIYQKKCQFKW